MVMCRFLIFSVFLVWGHLGAFAQQRTVAAHVQDAETGEALPYASIYVAGGRGTLSNAEGDFCIAANADDTLCIRCVGYATQRIAFKDLQESVRMVPAVVRLREVTVLSMDAILQKVRTQLKQSLSKNARQTYFCRIFEEIGSKQEMLEAFVEAKSMVHLRKMKVLVGRHYKPEGDNTEHPLLSSMNVHHFLELAPMMEYNAFWDNLLKLPFANHNIHKLYSYDYSIKDEEGSRALYVVELKPKVRTGAGRLMTGRLYIDAETLHLLRFQGSVPSVLMMNKIGSTGRMTEVQTDITVDYVYGKGGLAEVANISFDTRGDGVNANGFMVSAGEMTFPNNKGRWMEENMISSIKDAGFDSLMWANSDIVQKTMREYRVGHKQYVSDGQERVYLHTDNSRYFVGDTLWFSAYTRDIDRKLPSKISKVLYVELLGGDGAVMERKMVEMDSGHGQGYFALDGSMVVPGSIHIRAYTRWQLNWADEGEGLRYDKEILIEAPGKPSSPSDGQHIPVATCGNVVLEGIRNEYAPYERIDLKVRVTAPVDMAKCHLSITVRTREGQENTCDSGSVLSLEAESPSFPAPLKYAEPKEQSFILRGRVVRNEQDTIKISRWVNKTTRGYLKDMSKEAYIHSILRSNKGDVPLPHIQTDNGGLFELHVPLFYGQCLLYLGATDVNPYQLVSHSWDLSEDLYSTETRNKRKRVHSPFRIEMEPPYKTKEQKYGDQCIPIQGFSTIAEFYHPDYSRHSLPEGQGDYRRTLYWNPNLQLDENGEATITFYNNSRTTHISVEAEGQASDGTLLWGL